MNDYRTLKILGLILPFLHVVRLWGGITEAGGCREDEKQGVHPREPGDTAHSTNAHTFVNVSSSKD